MADKSLEKTIYEELQKTGYPTEIISASAMQKRGWAILHNPSYWDNEEHQCREFDIRAYRQWKTKSQVDTLGVYLIVECKKSEKPWVFFTTNELYQYGRLGKFIKVRAKGKHLFTNNESDNTLCSDDDLRNFHHYYRSSRLARTFYEPLKQQEKAAHSIMIYTAVMSVIKATLFHSNEQPYEKWISIYYPVIIFNGNLFEAFVNPDKSLEISRTNHIQLAFNYMQKEPRSSFIWSAQQEFIIDVIHEDYLDSFLNQLEEEHQQLASKI